MRFFSFLLCAAALTACQPSTPPADESTFTTPHAIPGLIEAEHYNAGEPGVAYLDNDAVNHGADYRGATEVDIEKRSDASNGYGIGWTGAGEWLAYAVEVKQPGRYRVEFPVASEKQGGAFHLALDGAAITGPIEIPDTGGWGILEMIETETTELAAGTYTLKIMMDTDGPSGGIGDIDYMRFSLMP